MVPGLYLHLAWNIAAENLGKDLLSCLYQSLRPARLLGFKSSHLNREFSRTFDILQIFELPALQLSAIGKIGIFRKGIVLPPAGIFDGPSAPHSCRPIEIEEDLRPRASAMLEDKVAVEQDGFNVGEK